MGGFDDFRAQRPVGLQRCERRVDKYIRLELRTGVHLSESERTQTRLLE